ncbi:hypothetical protein BDN70DRAFT_889342 [Pholiota conissans]|uniref:Chromatin modification-related protein n=1 Tax=Pholiota conissans TaxID=109636 RepID=A0A9P6D838_9AGAR|nr:hypothetical protein BDN70DRAFT_889342 [Pholiota conissans]
MPSYFSAPSSPTFGFFPTGTTSPNTFAGFHQNPRDAHNMYAAFGASTRSTKGNQPAQGGKTLSVFLATMADNAPYSLALLSEYTHTLDALPIDLSRNFADLRELDAVLSSSVLSITARIQSLTQMIEDGRASKEDRLWLLTEIAEEAQRLKLGGEDKIRVACQAADNLKAHAGHLRALADQLPAFDTAVLQRNTVFPHVSERSYHPITTMETGRRRRNVLGTFNPGPDPSPAKRKRIPKDDDDDPANSRTPKKPAGNDNARGRNNARGKKNDRVHSPSDSLASVGNQFQQGGHSGNGRGANATHPRAGNNAASGGTNKRRAGGANNHNNRNPTPLANEAYPGNDAHHTNGSRRGGAANDAYAVPPSASHPSLPTPYQNGAHSNGGAYDVHGLPLGAQDWNIPRAQQLEGPGMPVRSASIHSAAASVVPAVPGVAVDAADAGEGDGDGDDKTYCFCDGVSYGEMIACDDSRCEREWFHLACIGLTVPPEGTWYCDVCKKKPKRAVRGAKRRAGGAKT